MKPERLELEGFTAFREHAVLEFAGLDLFAITGPTGAGKSSLIDGITFALYGQVPRHGAGSVEPVISLGAARARIRFDFSVGEERYTAARFVSRTSGGGATTSEARLQRGEEVVASGAREVTKAVEALLGLGVDHFTRSVVLPQGEFAAFLHDPPAGQQELLTALLDFGVLDEVRRHARERARQAERLVDSNRVHLDGLADATPQAVAETESQVGLLEALADRVSEVESSLADAAKEREELETTVERLDRDRAALQAAHMPEGMTSVATAVLDAKQALADATGRREAAAKALDEARARLDRHASLDLLASYDELRRRLDDARARRTELDLAAAVAGRADAERAAAAADQAHAEATERLDALKSRHAVHALSSGLVAGDPCPVCARPLEEDPSTEIPGDLETAQQDVQSSVRQVTEARQTLGAAQDAVTRLETRIEAIDDEIAVAREALEGVPDARETTRLRRERAVAAEAVEAAVRARTQAEESCVAAERRFEDARSTERRMRETFDGARSAVVHLDPPSVSHVDLGDDWSALEDWAEVAEASIVEERTAAVARLTEVRILTDERRRELREALAGAGVHVDGDGSAVTAVASAQATARAAFATLRERLSLRQGLEADIAVFDEQRQVATHLSRHLQANGFEAWLLEEAIDALLEGANELLGDLSADAYSLAATGRVIEVVDHRNADERRSVKSLSGGETFLVSLALALSLGRRLLDMSERGGAVLEAIFLDEGFGTLDAETLDTVAAVVAELAARGRMVGVVTHVKDLADQIPDRFRVQPGPTGSTVTRAERDEVPA